MFIYNMSGGFPLSSFGKLGSIPTRGQGTSLANLVNNYIFTFFALSQNK